MNKENKGFSLIELVIVIAVLLILIILGLPRFLQFIEIARFRIAGLSLVESYKNCRAFPESKPIIPNIPKVSYEYQTCNESMSANINDQCNLEINLLTGEKNNWPLSYSECTKNKQEIKEKALAIDPNFFTRNDKGDVLFDAARSTYDNGHECDAAMGRLKKLDDPQKKDFEQPGVLMSSEATYYNQSVYPGGRSNSKIIPQCIGVRIPASFFDDGVLPEPFQVKKSKRIMSTGFKSSYSVEARNFDDQGRPILLVSPPEFTVDRGEWDDAQRFRWGPPVEPLDRENLWSKMKNNNPEIDWENIFEGIK